MGSGRVAFKSLTAAGQRLTGVTTTLPLLIGAFEAKVKKTVVVAQSRLPQLGID